MIKTAQFAVTDKALVPVCLGFDAKYVFISNYYVNAFTLKRNCIVDVWLCFLVDLFFLYLSIHFSFSFIYLLIVV